MKINKLNLKNVLLIEKEYNQNREKINQKIIKNTHKNKSASDMKHVLQ